jgi:hypothetical protein
MLQAVVLPASSSAHTQTPEGEQRAPCKLMQQQFLANLGSIKKQKHMQ